MCVSVTIANTASAVVVDSVNENVKPYDGITWNAREVGWFYTPTFSYDLIGINTKFSIANGWSVTEAVYTAPPSDGGTLLRDADFTPISNTFSGGTFEPIHLDAGTQYFFGFIDVQNLGVNVTYETGHTMLLPGTRYGFTGSLPHAKFDLNEGVSLHAQPILQFLSDKPIPSDVPEPGTAVTFLSGLLALTCALNRRYRA